MQWLPPAARPPRVVPVGGAGPAWPRGRVVAGPQVAHHPLEEPPPVLGPPAVVEVQVGARRRSALPGPGPGRGPATVCRRKTNRPLGGALSQRWVVEANGDAKAGVESLLNNQTKKMAK